ncbi:hypothetical protein QE152_g37056 [Popillia japonica]|uniref:Uncharacterized protein n=1 Tax=Popillia japonica TaxID=7064 RepID=A0AAW1IBQ3_POPJA
MFEIKQIAAYQIPNHMLRLAESDIRQPNTNLSLYFSDVKPFSKNGNLPRTSTRYDLYKDHPQRKPCLTVSSYDCSHLIKELQTGQIWKLCSCNLGFPRQALKI